MNTFVPEAIKFRDNRIHVKLSEVTSHSNLSWTIFQSPILSKEKIPHIQPFQEQTLSSNPLLFFRRWFHAVAKEGEVFLDPFSMIHLFPTFRYFTSPDQLFTLHKWLLECRANYLDTTFIGFTKSHQLSQKLLSLFFLFHEYLLYKSEHPNHIDAWDLIMRTTENTCPLPFTHLTWVDFPQQTHFNQKLCEILSKHCHLVKIIHGPEVKKQHPMRLERFTKLICRLHPKNTHVHWVFSPNTQSLETVLSLPFDESPNKQTWRSPESKSYDDIYGYLLDQVTPKDDESPSYVRPESFTQSVLGDHVLPDTLVTDPLWQNTQSHQRDRDAIALEARLWVEQLGYKAYTPTPHQTICIQTSTTWLPHVKELIFLDKAKLHVHLSPWVSLTPLRSQSMINIIPNHGGLA